MFDAVRHRPAATVGDETPVVFLEKMFDAIPTPFDSRQQVQDFFANDFGKVFNPSESLQVLSLFLNSNIEEKPDGKFDWKFSKDAMLESVRLGNARNYWSELENFKMPILLVRGETSHLLKLDTFKKMLEVNSQIKGVQIAGAGHWIHYEKYEEFTKNLREFLQLHNA